MNKFQVIAFDLDGTLAESKSPLTKEMAELIVRLLKKYKVIVASGGKFAQFETQFLSALNAPAELLQNLTLLPQSGSQMLVYKDGKWAEEFSHNLSEEEQSKIAAVLEDAVKNSIWEKPTELYGPAIEKRGSQVTYSALGQAAPVPLKKAWDPDRKKREDLASRVREVIPEYEVKIGGSTSIDVTKKGISKKSGILEYMSLYRYSADQITYIGDALFPGGNDHIVTEILSSTTQVSGPKETAVIIDSLLKE